LHGLQARRDEGGRVKRHRILLYAICFLLGSVLVPALARHLGFEQGQFSRGYATGYNDCRDELPEPKELQ
jgi:hypothetical protein